jgi:ankyrin repeat protein
MNNRKKHWFLGCKEELRMRWKNIRLYRNVLMGIFSLLVSFIAFGNEKTDEVKTALIEASEKGNIAIVKELIAKGANVDADSFFSGRPSGMSMAHNRVLDGTLGSMVELFRVPQRFPEADELQKSDWQGSVIAWWGVEDAQERILKALPHLSKEELFSAEAWITARTPLEWEILSKEAAIALDEIASKIIVLRKEQGWK